MRRTARCASQVAHLGPTWRSGDTSGGWRLVQDIRRSMAPGAESCGFAWVAPVEKLDHFSQRARQALAKETFATNAAILYWVSKAFHSNGLELDEDLCHQWISYIRQQSQVSSEMQLLNILQSLIKQRNRNKLEFALEDSALYEMEKACHELCRAAVPRFVHRHQHLHIQNVQLILSSYAAVYIPEYACVFEAIGPTLTQRLRSALEKAKNADDVGADLKLQELNTAVPFLLDNYAKVQVQDPDLFQVCLEVVDKEAYRLFHDFLALALHSAAVLGLHRPSLWRQTAKQLQPPCSWPTARVADVLGAIPYILLKGTGAMVEDGSVVELFRAAALELQRRYWDRMLRLQQELILLSCHAITKDIHDLPPIYLTKSFFAAVALDLVASEDAAQGASRRPATTAMMRSDPTEAEAALVEATTLMAYHMLRIIPRGLRVEMEMMAQLLLALAVRAPEAKLELLGFSTLIRVQQREIVRKAAQLGSGFSRCAAFAAAAVWPWREEQCKLQLRDEGRLGLGAEIGRSSAMQRSLAAAWLKGAARQLQR
eukprot:s1933_g3.t1